MGEAVQRLRGERYEVVVTDLYVTRGQEGVESIGGLLREAEETPVVVLSGWPVKEARRQGRDPEAGSWRQAEPLRPDAADACSGVAGRASPISSYACLRNVGGELHLAVFARAAWCLG